MFGEYIGVEAQLRLYFTKKVRDEGKYSSCLEMDKMIDEEIKKYMETRSISEIQEDTKSLDVIFADVEKAFEDSKTMNYYEKRKYIMPYLKSFYDKIKELYKSEEAFVEYEYYFVKIDSLCWQGTKYPYFDEIEHEMVETEPERTLDNIVHQTREKICSRERGWLFRNKCIDCQNYLNERFKNNDRIRNAPIDTQQDCKMPYYQHAINLVEIDRKKYILDPTFIQFCDLRSTPDIVGIPGCVGAVPGQYLMDTPEKREFLHNLIKYGFFEATEENLKMYFDSFVLANRGKKYYSSHPNARKNETEFNANDYVKMILGKKTIDLGDEGNNIEQEVIE